MYTEKAFQKRNGVAGLMVQINVSEIESPSVSSCLAILVLTRFHEIQDGGTWENKNKGTLAISSGSP